jgi:hypothetical protein
MSIGPVAITVADIAQGATLAERLVALNNAHAVELSWLAAPRLRELVTAAFHAIRVGEADAMLLAFDQSAAYDSPNFLWFRARMARFVYVDRVVVAAAARGQGLARLLYRDLFAHARRAGHDRVVCEVNTDPPNLPSDAFHAALGFTEIGTAKIHGGSKTVRYLIHHLSP